MVLISFINWIDRKVFSIESLSEEIGKLLNIYFNDKFIIIIVHNMTRQKKIKELLVESDFVYGKCMLFVNSLDQAVDLLLKISCGKIVLIIYDDCMIDYYKFIDAVENIMETRMCRDFCKIPCLVISENLESEDIFKLYAENIYFCSRDLNDFNKFVKQFLHDTNTEIFK